ncbi:DoxX family protein [Sphingobium sp. DEHP117]|uniref:DoxX family protein n=1 Tax=Sphingobium sp. DEHP117 TaxID=2993436 RepID=UPI0027D765DE|nr:DoxX family protein [Sphingobium sp. DEHP117]MDQ4419288.1 DoxX family protein [Sphingobium sp. DEHP117]
MIIRRIILAILSLPLALFFAFVGWHKVFSPLAELARHHSWTIWLPEWLGKLVGWSEMACAFALLLGQFPRWYAVTRGAAVGLIANQTVAAAFHLTHGEANSLPQNAVLALMLAMVALLVPPFKERK